MSQNSSLAVLSDCTDLYNSHVSLIGINGPPSVQSIENETILTNNTDISPGRVIGSMTFLERVQSTDLAALFPRGSLNQIQKKKKKKSRETSLSTSSQSSQNVSSLQNNTNDSVSASFEECSENKEEPNKPFNKRLYLKKKSVKLSFGSGSLNNSVSEKSLRRSTRAVNVTLDPLISERRNVTDENISDLESSKRVELEEKSAKILMKRSNRKKKSVNISFGSDSLDNSKAEKSLESSQIFNDSLPSKRRNATRRNKLISALNIDELESAECSGENSMTEKAISAPSSNGISLSQIDKETIESKLKSAEGNSFNENMPEIKKTNSHSAIDYQSVKVFNKNLYLKKKSINLSFDSSSLNDEVAEKSLKGNSQADNVSLNPLSPKMTNDTESADIVSTSFDVSSKINNEGEPPKVFNKNLYLKKKSIKISFDSSSFNDSKVDNKGLEKNSEDVDVSSKPLSPKITNVTESAENISISLDASKYIENEEELSEAKNSINISLDSSSLNDQVAKKSLEKDKQAVDISLDPLSPKMANNTESAEIVSTSFEVSSKINNKEEPPKVFNKNLYLKKKSIKISFDSSSLNDSTVEKRIEVVDVSSKPLSSEITNVTGSAENVAEELIPLQNSSDTTNYLPNESNVATSNPSEIGEENILATENCLLSNILTSDSLKTVEPNFSEQTSSSQINNYGSKESLPTSPEENMIIEDNHLSTADNDLIFSGQGSYSQINSVDSDQQKNQEVVLSKKNHNGIINTEDENLSTAESHIHTDDSLKAVEEAAEPFNKEWYLRKKSINVSFDSTSFDDSNVNCCEKNTEVVDVFSKPLFSKIMNATESAVNVSISFDASQNIENDLQCAKEFDKNLYLKKKSINLSFDSSSLNDEVTEKSLKGNIQADNVSLNPLSPKMTNDTESADIVSTSFDVSSKINNEGEPPKVFNKNLYLKKKSIKISFDSSSLNDSMVGEGLKRNSEVVDVSSKPLSPKVTNNTESTDIVSTFFDVSSKINNEEESAKAFNKNTYLKKKSINILFDSSSLNDSKVEKGLEINSEDVDVSSKPLSPKITNVTESAENISISFDASKNIENDVKCAKKFNKNLYLKKKSIRISFDSSTSNDPISENSLEKNSEVVNVLLDPLSSNVANVIESVGNLSVNFDASSKINNEEEFAKVFNKNSYLKKKSIKISFDSSSSNDQVDEKTIEKNNQADDVLSDQLSPKVTNNTESADIVSTFFDLSSKIKNEEESAKAFNKNSYLKNKSIKIAFDSCSLNNSKVEKELERNSEIVDVSPSKPLSSLDECVTESAQNDSVPSEEFIKEIEIDNNIIKDNHLSITDSSPLVTHHGSKSTISNLEQNDEIVVSKNGNTNIADVHDSNDANDEYIIEGDKCKSSLVHNATHIDDEKNISTTLERKIATNDSLKAIDAEPAKTSDKNMCETSINDSKVEKRVERNNPVPNVSLYLLSSEIKCSTEPVKNVTEELINLQNSYIAPNDIPNVNVNTSNIATSNSSKVDDVAIIDEEKNVSAKEGDRLSNILSSDSSKAMNEEESELDSSTKKAKSDGNVEVKGVLNSSHIVNDLHNEKNINKSSQVKNSVIVDEEKTKSTTENNMPIKILNNNSSKVIQEKEVLKDCSKVNLKPDSTSIDNPCSRMNEKANESKLIDLKDISEGNVTKSNSSPNDNASIFNVEKNKSETKNTMNVNNLTNDMSKIRDKRAIEEESMVEESRRKRTKSIPSSCDQINEGSKESQSTSSQEYLLKEDTSEDDKQVEKSHSIITDIGECCSANASNANISSEGSKQIEEAVLSESFKSGSLRSSFKKGNRKSRKKKNKKDKHMESTDVQNNDDSLSSEDKSNGCNIRNSSKINEDDIVESISDTENHRHTNILANEPSNGKDESSVVQSNSQENSPSSEKIKSVSTSINVPCSEKEESNESQLKLSEESNLNSNTFKENKNIEDNSKHGKANLTKKTIDMRMSVGLSVICKDDERVPVTDSVKNICHSTPLVKYQKNRITRKKNSTSEEVNSGSNHIFTCPNIPARNLRERSINNKALNISKTSLKGAKNHSDNLEKSTKKRKSSPSSNKSEDFIEDISIIPDPKPFTRSRVMYHSTPINRTFSKKSRSKIKFSDNVEMENGNIQQDDKMIQVSKSIFGSSSEVTYATASKNKSISKSTSLSDDSSPHDEKNDIRTKRKSDSLHSRVKKLPKMESIEESRSYHSNFISTFEDDSSYCTTRKSVKRVAFKSISSDEITSSGYGNSSEYYASRNKKSVGFRDAISLIEDTVGNSSEGDIRDANNGNLSIVNPASIRVSDVPGTVNDSKSSIDRNDFSLNYSAEIPEIILTENVIENNEISEECSLFNRLIEMAETKKTGRNVAATRGKIQNLARKTRRSSNLALGHRKPDLRHNEKWVSPNLIKYLNKKLMTDDLDYVIKTERIVSILCSAVSAVRNLQDAEDIDFALLPLKNVLVKFSICHNMIEYCTFISRFTPFEFQRKALPLEGYFGSIKRGINKILTDPILTETEKTNVFL